MELRGFACSGRGIASAFSGFCLCFLFMNILGRSAIE